MGLNMDVELLSISDHFTEAEAHEVAAYYVGLINSKGPSSINPEQEVQDILQNMIRQPQNKYWHYYKISYGNKLIGIVVMNNMVFGQYGFFHIHMFDSVYHGKGILLALVFELDILQKIHKDFSLKNIYFVFNSTREAHAHQHILSKWVEKKPYIARVKKIFMHELPPFYLSAQPSVKESEVTIYKVVFKQDYKGDH